jgi:NNP family nitrate/nitrite transporter-like MFS transporter
MQQHSLIQGRGQKALFGLLGAGVLGFLAGLYFNDARMWPVFLLNSFYFLTIALGAVVFVAIQHVSNAGWSAAIRRVPEAMMTYVPVGAVLLLAVFFGRHAIYEWSHGIEATNDAMRAKAIFLSTPFFFARMVVILAAWMLFARLLWRESRRQDEDGELRHTERSKKISAGFLAAFAVTFSVASFDWMMSLEPEFYSTIFAFYCFAGLFLSGIAAITLAIIILRKRGYLQQVNEDHLHNLGKLLFGFSTFWAYIWLSQYLLIYYANLPEETIFYINQTVTPGWRAIFFANLFLNWIIPFLMLISRKAKRNQAWLAAASIIVLVGHWVDLYLIVLPTSHASALPGLIDIALALGFASLFIQTVASALSQIPLMPVHDPYLVESLALHSLETPEPAFGSDRRASRQLALATLGFAVSFAVWGMVGALAPKFREMYGLSAFQTSLLIAVPVLLGSIGRLPMGILADKLGGRKVFGLLLLFCLFPALGATFSRSYGALLAWGFLIGFAGTSFSVGVAFSSKWFPARQQGTALGIYGMGNIGQSIAVFGAPALVAATSDWRIPFWVFGAAAGVMGVIFLLSARNAEAKTEPKKFHEYFAILRRERLSWALSLFYFMTFGGFVALSIYLPTLLKDLFGLSPTDAGARVAGFVLVATTMRPIGGWLADRYGGAHVLVLVLGLIAVLALGMTSSSMPVFTVGALGTAALLGLGNGAVFKLVPEYFPRETGTVTGLVGAAGGLGGFFPPLVLGVIKGQTGSYELGFIFLSGFALICLAVNYFAFLRREEEDDKKIALS